jgi:1,4-alpha-glucan branching enzyme
MVSLALVLELHHPLPGPGEAVGAGWASTAIECDWPVLRAVSRFAEKGSGGALTLAISPSWTALASDASARVLLLTELNRRESVAAGESSLRRFLIDRWEGDAVALVRDLAGSGAVDVIPMT